MNLTFTVDHRYGDITTWSPMHMTMRGYIANPEKFNPDDYKEALHWSEI